VLVDVVTLDQVRGSQIERLCGWRRSESVRLCCVEVRARSTLALALACEHMTCTSLHYAHKLDLSGLLDALVYFVTFHEEYIWA